MTKRARRNAGFGRGLPLTRSEVRRVAQAARHDWDIPAGTRRLIVGDISSEIETPNVRLSIAIASAFIDMSGANQRQHV